MQHKKHRARRVPRLWWWAALFVLVLSAGAWAASEATAAAWNRERAGARSRVLLARGAVSLERASTLQFALLDCRYAPGLRLGPDARADGARVFLPAFEHGGAAGQSRWQFTLPLWMPTLVCAAAVVYGWATARRVMRGHCAACGYDMRALASHAACPECGAGAKGAA